MNILIVDNSTDITGALKSISNLCTDLKNEHRFTFLIPKNSKNKEFLQQLGFHVLEMNFIEISKGAINNIKYIPFLFINAIKLGKIVKKNNIDIVHTNDMYNMLPVVSKLFHKAPVITHIRRMPESFPLFLYTIWKNIHQLFSDKMIAVSFANKKGFDNHQKVTVVYNPLPLKEKSDGFIVRENGPLTILYLSNYIQGKGQDFAIDALLNLNKKNPTLKFNVRFVGSDMGLIKNQLFKQSLEDKVLHSNLKECISFEEGVADVESIYKSCDICLNFSESESLSRVSMEALYYGIPLIATDVGGTSELFEDGQSGFLVENRNAEQMKNRIEQLIIDTELRKRFSLKSRKNMREKFSVDKTSKILNDEYFKIIK